MKNRILYLLVFIFAICILHNSLFQLGFFGGSTYAIYNDEFIRVLKVRNQMVLISPSFTNRMGVVYSRNKNDKWVWLAELDFSVDNR